MRMAVGSTRSPAGRPRRPPPGRSIVGTAATKAVSYGLLIGVAGLMFVPFLWSLTTSFKTSPEAAQVPPTILPRQPTIDAYRTVILQAPFARWFANSVMVALAVVATRCTLDTLAGYAFARMRFPGRELLFSAVISTLMVSPTRAHHPALHPPAAARVGEHAPCPLDPVRVRGVRRLPDAAGLPIIPDRAGGRGTDRWRGPLADVLEPRDTERHRRPSPPWRSSASRARGTDSWTP